MNKCEEKQEEWRDVVGYEGRYQVSNSGKIKSMCRRNVIVLRFYKNNHGYLTCVLSGDERRNTKSIHRIVASAFIPNPLGLKTVNHKDGNKTNNSSENLEWCTSRDNLKHSHCVLGRTLKGEKANGSKLSCEQVLSIVKEYGNGATPAHIVAKKYGISDSNVRYIAKGKSWSHVTGIPYRARSTGGAARGSQWVSKPHAKT